MKYVWTKSNQFKDQKWLTCKLEGWSHFWTIEQASLCRHRWVLSNYKAIQPNSLELQKRIFRELKKKKKKIGVRKKHQRNVWLVGCTTIFSKFDYSTYYDWVCTTTTCTVHVLWTHNVQIPGDVLWMTFSKSKNLCTL